MKKPRIELGLLALAAFLAPIIGGQVSLEALPLEQDAFSSAFGAVEAPFMARALLGTLIALSLALAMARNRVIQMPRLQMTSLILALVAVVGLSIFTSAFPYVSYSAWVTWIVYGMCAFAVVGISGKRLGVRTVLWALVAGGTLTALKGVSEYAAVKAIEPGHRIFAGWNNPNAVAGLFCILVPIGLGLCVTSERLEAIGSGLCTAFILFALALTQSKGGILSTGIAVIVFTGTALAWKGRKQVARTFVPLAVAGVLIAGVTLTANSATGASPLGRVVNSQGSQEQSAGFRTLLWRGTVDLIRAKPTGYGVGTYRFESARPGLTEQTFHAHETWLQLAMETSPLGLLALIAISGLWLKSLLSGATKWPWPDSGLRAAVLAASVGAAVNGLFESNLIYLGTGIALFLVLGTGMQMSSDATAPEYSPKNLRWALALIGCVLPVLLMWHTALVETSKSSALTKAASGDRAGAAADLETARSLAPIDGEAIYLASGFAQSEDERTSLLARASTVLPSTKYLRAYARSAIKSGRKVEANKAIEAALLRDPNNLQTREMEYRFLADDGQMTKAVERAKDLISVESSAYFKTRALPEMVPLETYDARVFVAEHTTDRTEKGALLKQAIQGYDSFFQLTVPVIKRLTGGDPKVSYLGHSMGEVEDVRTRTRAAIEQFRGLYGDSISISDKAWLGEVSSRLAAD